MKDALKLNLIPLLLILCPVLMIGTHYINVAEFYLYTLFFINYKKFTRNEIALIFFRYGIIFAGVIILTSLIAGKVINNHDLFILRNCAQLGIGILLFQQYFQSTRTLLSHSEFENVLFRTFLLLSLPVLIVFLQRLDLLGMREIVMSLYRPKFHFLGVEIFSEYRYTSVFKDFFTSAVYYIALSFGMVTLITRSTLARPKKLLLLITVFITFLAQVYVSRTGLIFIPIVFAMTFIFSKKKSVGERIKSIAIVLVSLIPLYFLLTHLILSTLPFNREWVTEASSFTVMQKWNEDFFEHVARNPEMLFRPNHEYDLVENYNPELYSDGFYAQEIYRYGIYGLFAFLYLCGALLVWSRKTNTIVALLTLILMILNYKGGNVFFMPKNIYLLSFIFVFTSLYNKEEESKA